MKQASYSLRTPRNYPENEGIWEVVWHDVFMPFDVVCGTDNVPHDKGKRIKKTHWWVYARTSRDIANFNHISQFIDKIPTKEFKTLEEAINFCIGWRKNWLEKELAITFSPPSACTLPDDEQ